MDTDNDAAFEQRLRHLLAKTNDIVVPELSAERLQRLRSLIPHSSPSFPSLSLIWRKTSDGVRNFLVLVEMIGVHAVCGMAPVLRDGSGGELAINAVSLPLPEGEVVVQVVPIGGRKAKALLSAKGRYSTVNDLSVELLHGGRLVEARPLEQKAELTLGGEGCFTLVLYIGDTAIGRMNVDISGEKDSDQ